MGRAFYTLGSIIFIFFLVRESFGETGGKEAQVKKQDTPPIVPNMRVQHLPFKIGQCEICHVEKDGNKYALSKEPPDLCYMCHERKDTKSRVHGPVAAGMCTSCHDPHQSNTMRMLKADSVNDLCFMCHMDKKEQFSSKPYMHPPVKDQCINCHDPHQEDHRYRLFADRRFDLCVSCHADKKEWVEKVKNKHGAIKIGDRCLNCHDPHVSENEKFLRKPTSMDVCLTCHNKELKRDEDGTVLMNMKKHLDENPDWHGPIQWGDCAMCHNPHGSDNFRMLKLPFPETFYASFNINQYICFMCHETEKFTEVLTTTATNFRNGEVNLHYVHVNGKKGRTCRACHDWHATRDLPHHIRKYMKFGKIKAPLRYIPTKTGGSCAPMCHPRRYYDRENPVINKR